MAYKTKKKASRRKTSKKKFTPIRNIKIRLKSLFLTTLVFLGVVAIGGFWYSRQDVVTKEKVQGFALDALELARDNDTMPPMMINSLDWVADLIPLSKGKLFKVSQNSPKSLSFIGGMPKSKENLTILKNEGFWVGYDEKRKNPAWVAYRLFKNPRMHSGKRPSRFKLDERTVSRVKHDDYTGTGYDRGHMAPNYGIAKCYGKKAQHETFAMSNIAPQRPDLNRKIWKRLEMRVAKRLTRRFNEIWVMTGPVYDKKKPIKRLASGVQVPDGFFKILMNEYRPGQMRSLSFYMPNNLKGKEPLKRYICSIKDIEKKTGLTFFSQLPLKDTRAFKENVSRTVW